MTTETPPPGSRWVTATSGVRSASTWLATTIGAAAAAVFGAGPILKNDVDTSDWTWRWWLLVAAAVVVGAAAVVHVIARLLALQVPIEITLDQLPPALKKRIEANKLGEYLPGEAKTVGDLKELLRAAANAAVTYEAEAKKATGTEKTRLEALTAVQRKNADVYIAKRDELYELAAYEMESERLTPRANRRWIAFGGSAVVAVAAMAAFTLLISPGASKGQDGKNDTVAPTSGLLTPTDGTTDLWTKLGLDECENAEGAVPVFVLSQTETDYEVQPVGVPGDECAHYSFTVPRSLVDAVVVEPIKVTVTVDDTNG